MTVAPLACLDLTKSFATGGSNFAAAYNFEELEASKCTTSAISIDRRSPFHWTSLI